jgi:hypothetical protein|tara:strand:- start:852 stop:1010 length:159 start_codon:yes stop_codon:yes gene_type:complete
MKPNNNFNSFLSDIFVKTFEVIQTIKQEINVHKKFYKEKKLNKRNLNSNDRS